MKEVLIVRDPSSDAGVFGRLSVPGKFECYSAELPWRDLDGDGKRDAGRSCVKSGTYLCKWTKSPSRKNADGTPEWSYELQAVPDAAGIRIHLGNFVGDRDKGLLADAEGCILLGRSIADVEIPEKRRVAGGPRTQRGVTSSRDAVTAFVAQMGKEPFRLKITWAPGAAPGEGA